MDDWLFFTLWIVGTILIVAALCALGVSIDYYASCWKADIFNKMNNTSWSCWDFYWAGSQINNQTITVH
jgi:uncharacterized membrane protein